MRIAFFYHSIVSDWNNGNAHFLRGIVTELLARGHDVRVCEPENGWSLQNLTMQFGQEPFKIFRKLFSGIRPYFYSADLTELDKLLEDIDVVIVHEWNDARMIRRIAGIRKGGGAFKLLFHDTHHRYFTSPHLLDEIDLRNFDGVLAFGEELRLYYIKQGIAPAWTWHEAADTRIFYPRHPDRHRRDLIWIGNGGDGERNLEYRQFLLEPVRVLKLQATVYGVRYDSDALQTLQTAGIQYGGWLANYQVPAAFAGHRLTLHIPRAPYVRVLKGIPTIRPFEALACGIPLICTPWEDTENLFSPGKDYLVARNSAEMKRHIRDVLNDAFLAAAMSAHGRRTIMARHTCAHRVNELMAILASLGVSAQDEEPPYMKKAGKQ
ncbi:MAG: glycosyltransferase [Desulfatitalea sp. BRH_c12]|nr:MAG: glycosyltransferase [Desulfatitalea sp. BRH_c12]